MSEGIYNIRPTEESKCPYTEEHCNTKELVNNNKLGKVKDIKTVCKQCEHYPGDSGIYNLEEADKITLSESENQNQDTTLTGFNEPDDGVITSKLQLSIFVNSLLQQKFKNGDALTLNKQDDVENIKLYLDLCDRVMDVAERNFFKTDSEPLTIGILRGICEKEYTLATTASYTKEDAKIKENEFIENIKKAVASKCRPLCDDINETNKQKLDEITDKVEKEMVNHPDHYKGERKYEPIDVIEDWGLGFCDGNALKYISRLGRKDPNKTIEDIDKAIWYLYRLKQNLLSK